LNAVYYYVNNYLLLLAVALAGFLARRPLGLLGGVVALCALLSLNDPFAAAVKCAGVDRRPRVFPCPARICWPAHARGCAAAALLSERAAAAAAVAVAAAAASQLWPGGPCRRRRASRLSVGPRPPAGPDQPSSPLSAPSHPPRSDAAVKALRRVNPHAASVLRTSLGAGPSQGTLAVT
jgi:hypothetical protein